MSFLSTAYLIDRYGLRLGVDQLAECRTFRTKAEAERLLAERAAALADWCVSDD